MGTPYKPCLSFERSSTLGGSWVAISRVISRVTILITHIRGLITPLITTLSPKPLNPKPHKTLKGTLNPYNPTYNYPKP